MPARPKKPYKSRTSRGKGKGLGGAAPPFIGGKIDRKKGRRGRRGSSRGGGNRSIKLVFA